MLQGFLLVDDTRLEKKSVFQIELIVHKTQ